MATRVKASALFPFPIEFVWARLRLFTFPGLFIEGVTECVMVDGLPPTTVGALRAMKWQTGETRKHRLLSLSDQFYESAWEIVESAPETETEGAISTIKLYRVTENDHTLVEWSIDFSSDVKPETLKFELKSITTSLAEIRSKLK